jgi:hypothetical protein
MAPCGKQGQQNDESTMQSAIDHAAVHNTFNALSSRDQRCGSLEPRRRSNGGMQWRQCDRASCFGFLWS